MAMIKKVASSTSTISKDYVYSYGYVAPAKKKENEKYSLESARREATVAAKDLLYPQEVLDALHVAKTIPEISRIMTTARHGGYDK